MQSPNSRNLFLDYLILILGQAAAASSVLFIKMSSVAPAMLGALRLILASLILLPVYFKKTGSVEDKSKKPKLVSIILGGFFLALHFITWNFGARLTSVANASLIVNLIPLAMPILVLILFKEVPLRREIGGTFLALAGLIFLLMPSISINQENIIGDLACLISMVFLSFYLIQAKHTKTGSIWLYIIPVYFFGGLFCFLGQAILEPEQIIFTFQRMNYSEIFYIVSLALIPTIIGHTALNHSMRVLPSQLVGISNLSQVVWASIFGFLFFKEVPKPEFYIASTLIALGFLLAIGPQLRLRRS